MSARSTKISPCQAEAESDCKATGTPDQPCRGRPAVSWQATPWQPAAWQASRVVADHPVAASRVAGQPCRGRPPARGGPTLYDSFPSPYIVGPPLAGGLGVGSQPAVAGQRCRGRPLV